MPNPSLTTIELTALGELVTRHDGPGIVAWCLEHGGFHAAADPYTLRWVSPCGMADVAVGPERGFDLQVLRLGEAILTSAQMGEPSSAWSPPHRAA